MPGPKGPQPNAGVSEGDAPKQSKGGVNTNPSGASDEQLAKNELVGKVRGPDVDSSFHVYEFTDPQTGEALKTEQTVHDDSGQVKS